MTKPAEWPAPEQATADAVVAHFASMACYHNGARQKHPGSTPMSNRQEERKA